MQWRLLNVGVLLLSVLQVNKMENGEAAKCSTNKQQMGTAGQVPVIY